MLYVTTCKLVDCSSIIRRRALLLTCDHFTAITGAFEVVKALMRFAEINCGLSKRPVGRPILVFHARFSMSPRPWLFALLFRDLHNQTCK